MSNEPNPYASPAIVVETPSRTGERTIAITLAIRNFRSQSQALGAAWLFFAIVAAGIACVLFLAEMPEGYANVGVVLGSVTIVLAIGWGAAGVGALMKKAWSFYLGLVLSYVVLIPSLLSLSVCQTGILVASIVQGHRVIGFMRKLQANHIPLHARR